MTSSPIPFRLIAVAIIAGLLYRLHPIALGMPALAETFLTEDGYLMLTVARNMAIGLGMTVSDGTIATNGVQPMATFLFTIPYLLTDGDKVAGIVGVHLILAIIALAAVFAVKALAARLLRDQDAGALLPWLVGALWFLGPVLLRHSMNGLETGLITLVTVVTLLQFARVVARGTGASLADCLGLGLMCGLAFLARIDAAILGTAIFAVWAIDMLTRQRQGIGTVLARLVPAGIVSLVVAAPWLLNNLLGFGSIMPISGSAQSLDTEFGAHAELVPVKVFEHLFPMLPVPAALERNPLLVLVLGISTVIVLAAYLVRVAIAGSPVTRAVVAAYALHAVALVAYYGLFFGAPHFLSRYLAPLAPLLIVAAVSVALDLGRWLMPRRRKALAMTYGLGGLILSGALLVRLLLPGAPDQGHEQVVAWVGENVPEEAWVGAVQTGTLGYWHDRTINLDGKVNPEALEARRTEGHVLNYVTASEIDYIVDWAGVGNWVRFPEAEGGFADAFELVLQNPGLDLAVIRRRDPQQR
jgi:hypothetical protein